MIRTTSSQRGTAYRAKLIKRPELLSDGIIEMEFAISDTEKLFGYVKPTLLEKGTILNFKTGIRYLLDGHIGGDGRYYVRKMQPH